jgi:predicted aspartyl protease
MFLSVAMKAAPLPTGSRGSGRRIGLTRFIGIWLVCVCAISPASAWAEGVPSAAGVEEAADTTVSTTAEPLFASPTRIDRIGRIVAPVYINGQGPFRLVVDTGASHTTVSPELAKKLGLESSPESRIMLNGVTGMAEVPAVNLDVIRAGDLVILNAQAPVVWSSVMAGAEGILGVAGLRRERIFVDFRTDRIVISRSRGTEDLSKYLKVRGQLVAGGLLAVDARIGGVAARAIIDTGAERTLGNLALRDALRRRNKHSKSTVTEVYGTTDAVSSGELELAPPIVLGAASVSQVSVVYGDFHIFKVWGLDERPAVLIGMDVLGTVGALVIDFRRREMYLRSG